MARPAPEKWIGEEQEAASAEGEQVGNLGGPGLEGCQSGQRFQEDDVYQPVYEDQSQNAAGTPADECKDQLKKKKPGWQPRHRYQYFIAVGKLVLCGGSISPVCDNSSNAHCR